MNVVVFYLVWFHLDIITYAFSPIRNYRSAIKFESTSLGISDSSKEFETPPILNTGKDDFENDGMFGWMIPYLGMMGMEDGKVLKYGLLAVEPDQENTNSTREEFEIARQEAVRQMTNIGKEERRRRDQVGDVLIPLTTFYAVFSSLFLDDGTLLGRLARFAIVIPLFFTFGYKVSAKTGLCNVAQKGLWDVDDTGLKQVDDPLLARKFVERVNSMNINTALQALLLATSFAALPHSTTQAASFVALLCTTLYILKDRIPVPSD
jgi:hypothetical protein